MKNPIKILAATFSGAFTAARAAAQSQPPVPAREPIPTQQAWWLNPRYEPGNISAGAVATTINNAVREAESGEPKELFRFYRDVLLGDDHIQGEITKRKLAVLGQPLAVLPCDKEDPEDVKAAAVCLQAIADCANWGDGLAALLDSAALWPVSANELLFQPANRAAKTSDGEAVPFQYTFRRWAPVNPILFCYRWAYFSGGVGLGVASPVQNVGLGKVGAASPYTIDLERWEPWLKLWPIDEAGRLIYDAANASYLDPERYVTHRGHLLTQMKDNWGGPGRCILGWYLLRQLGRDWFGRFMERYGSPFPVGKTNVQDPQSVLFLQAAFSTATKIGGLVIGQDDQIELQSAVVQGGAEGHALWIKTCNDAISFAITGYKSGSQPAGINAGESDQSESIRSDVRIFDGKKLAETLEKQPFARLLQFNGLAGRVRVVLGGLSAEDSAEFATLLKTMSDAGYQAADESLPVVEEKTGMKWERKAAAQPDATQRPPSPGGEGRGEGGQPQKIKLLASLRAPTEPDAVEKLVIARQAVLAAAYKGSMAPFRKAIEDSTSRADLEARLKTLYADWTPERLTSEINTALQIAAAAGAAQAKP